MKNSLFFQRLILLSMVLFLRPGVARDLPDSTRGVSNEDVREISSQLIAPCCWTMTADAHSSPIAYEMRMQIRGALAQGKSEGEILQAYVSQYGERILAKPTKQGFNLLAWILPFAALLTGSWILWRFLHRHAEPAKASATMRSDPHDPYAQRMERELRELNG
ncbi:MAG: cytochrome c-type biogenesis protein CcmH [candidate division KSB1 bacterium]|nr:cytochrome c-type biogenesis protein CcmH [candidate division KSB1 bacterium]MDZ7364821.1 cytochrome c-type biogenesis protein CcmH [candidate division KSB1 bacterium]MDZ7402924.1 cytochrome c-type biogenesis protein CcmH [candidate division KSB1 bacterium]